MAETKLGVKYTKCPTSVNFNIESNECRIFGVLKSKSCVFYVDWVTVSVAGYDSKSLRCADLSKSMFADLATVVYDSIYDGPRDVSRFNDLAKRLIQ